MRASSLARRILKSPSGFRLFAPPAKGTFQLSLTLLLHYRSRVVFRVGSKWLPNSHAISKAQYSRTSRIIFPARPYRAITLSGTTFQSISGWRVKMYRSLQHHISGLFPGRIQFALCRVRSPLLTASRLISFPRGTKMLQSPRFLILTDCSEEQEVPFGDRRIKSSLRLPGAYRSLARPSSAPEPSHSPDGIASR